MNAPAASPGRDKPVAIRNGFETFVRQQGDVNSRSLEHRADRPAQAENLRSGQAETPEHLDRLPVDEPDPGQIESHLGSIPEQARAFPLHDLRHLGDEAPLQPQDRSGIRSVVFSDSQHHDRLLDD
jgi:hypothetical protein